VLYTSLYTTTHMLLLTWCLVASACHSPQCLGISQIQTGTQPHEATAHGRNRLQTPICHWIWETHL